METIGSILGAIVLILVSLGSFFLGRKAPGGNDDGGNLSRARRELDNEADALRRERNRIESERTELEREKGDIGRERKRLDDERTILDRDKQLIDELRRRDEEKTGG